MRRFNLYAYKNVELCIQLERHFVPRYFSPVSQEKRGHIAPLHEEIGPLNYVEGVLS